ncbi:MAG: aldehyde ferredoxin oxidoreductase C-terminal domain-containing protein [Dehalococcoidales bacterium]|jgi:aldehyde:ferredoxin oxidoreductase|nr:aldehyde ferredoxin oxidoreductase C-terminal domain-containing protein [Dehalococcoidales bacterium]
MHGSTGKILRVDLTQGKTWDEALDEATLRKYLGGTGLGMKYLAEEVDPRTDWSDPKNIFYLGSGPLGGTRIPGSASISFVTKGAMTNGATSTQANGNFGAYLKWCCYDGILVQGSSLIWKYLYLHKDGVELRDASQLLGKDTWETEDAIKKELGYKERTMSVFSIGPAGENLVRFSGVFGDRGHAAAHNGTGAVMGSKKLKAFAVARVANKLTLTDPEKLGELARKTTETAKTFGGGSVYNWGTSRVLPTAEAGGWLPVKNYQTDLFPEKDLFDGARVRPLFESKNYPCYACSSHHYELMKVTEGPCTGYFGKEPEYEQWASWGPQIFQKDPGAAVMLSNEVDKLGMDTNEAGWVVGWVMECYQKGALKKEDLDGLEMTWGNVAATLALLKNIAHRRGYGATLAEGVKHAAEKLGGESVNWAIFTGKRNSPRGHDHRGRWVEMVDTIVSDTGTLATQMLVVNKDLWKIPNPMDIFDPDHVVQAEANSMGSMTISDCLVQCWFTGFNDTETQTEAINAATGWNMSLEEVMKVGRRVVNMMRLYNLKVGLTPDKETPSARYCSQSVDGPNKDKPITPHWEKMLDNYYQLMGWDRKTGRPLPETIKELALEDFAK